MVEIEYDSDDGHYHNQYQQHGVGTQDAASVLMGLGFGAASGEKHR